MEPDEQKKTHTASHFSLYLKCGAIFLLLLMSFIVVACSTTGSDTTTTNLGAPPVTVTIRFNNDLTTTPLPGQPAYLCGAWVTNTSPGYVPGSTVPVYAKFIHLVSGNPQGVANARAQATLYLANAAPQPLQPTVTGPDGLAVFSFQLPNDPNIANRNNLVTVSFTGPDGSSCKVDQDRAAYFTPMLVTPTVTSTPGAPGTPVLPPGVPGVPGATPSPAAVTN
jgi:hypothetical protein